MTFGKIFERNTFRRDNSGLEFRIDLPFLEARPACILSANLDDGPNTQFVPTHTLDDCTKCVMFDLSDIHRPDPPDFSMH